MTTTSQALLTRAIELQQVGDLQGAKRLCEQAASADPHCADALHMLGVILAMTGDRTGAKRNMERALEISPTSAVFHNNLGKLYQAIGGLAEAQACHERSIELAPDYENAHYNLGVVATQLGGLDQAKQAFLRSLELSPDNAPSSARLAELFLKERSPEQALPLFERAAAVTPSDANVRAGFSAALLDTGRIDEAREAAEAALRLSPDHPRALLVLAVLSLMTADVSTGHTLIARARFSSLKRRKDSLFATAQECLSRDRLDAADLICQQLIQASPDDHRVHQLRRAIDWRLGGAPFSDAGMGLKYLVSTAWGYGFWSDVAHTIGTLLLAEAAGRVPIVYWGSNSQWWEDGSANAFHDYFAPVSEVTLADLAQMPHTTFWPPGWRDDTLNGRIGPVQDDTRPGVLSLLARAEQIVVARYPISVSQLKYWLFRNGSPQIDLSELYRHAMARYLRLEPDVQRAVDAAFERYVAGKTYIAVHVRGTDKRGEVEHLDAINTAYFANVDALERDLNLKRPHIFLLTDSEDVVRSFAARYSERLIYTDSRRSNDAVGVHYKSHSDRRALAREVIVDTYLAVRAAGFLGNGGSLVSCMIELLRPPSAVTRMLWPNVLFELGGEEMYM